MSDKQVEIKQDILDLADKLRPTAKLNEEKGTVEFDNKLFIETLPEGITDKMVKAVEHHKQNFGLAQTLVTGEIAIEYMKKNKDVEDIRSTVNFPVGKSVAVINRETAMRNPQSETTTMLYGYSSTRIVTKTPGSQTLAVRQRIGELAKKAGIGAK